MVQQLVSALVTGTDTGSVIIQNILALAVSLLATAAYRSDSIWKTGRIRGNLNWSQLQHDNPEPSRENFSRACVETMGSAPLIEEEISTSIKGGDIVQANGNVGTT